MQHTGQLVDGLEVSAAGTDDPLQGLGEQLRSHLVAGAERLRTREGDATAGALGEDLLYLAGHLEEALNRSGEDDQETLLRTAGYLGSETYGLQWTLERGNLGLGSGLAADQLDPEIRERWTQAIRLFEAGDCRGARAAFLAAAASAELKPIACQYLGVLAMSDGDLKEAVKQFETARRVAGSERERALASCHLGRAWFAAGDVMRAAKAALAAAESDPAKARFWYEAAVYCARLNQPEHFSEFLSSAIRCDWVYWAIAAADPDLEPAREQVVELLEETRQEQRRTARLQLDKLRNIINTLSETDARGDVMHALKLSHRLEDQFREANFFSYAALHNAAIAAQRNVLQHALISFEGRIRILESALAEQTSPKPKPAAKPAATTASGRTPQTAGESGLMPVVAIGVKIWSVIAMLACAYWGAIAIVSSGRERAQAVSSIETWGLLLLVPAVLFYVPTFLKRKRTPPGPQPEPAAVEPAAPNRREAIASELDRIQKLRDTLAEYLQTMSA